MTTRIDLLNRPNTPMLAVVGWFLGFTILGCSLSCVASELPVVGAAATNTAPLTITHGPFLQAPSETGITVSWTTSRKCVSHVEYRAETATGWLSDAPTEHGLIAADLTCHNVPLTGLSPGTLYVYRVVSREIVDFPPYKVVFGSTVTSREYRFTTLDDRKPVTSFVVVNDRHENVPALAASLKSVNWTNVDVAFLNGDMVHAVKDRQHLERCVVDPCVEAFARNVPLVYVRGNHETRGSLARQFLDWFPTDSGRYYYTIQHGPVSFLVLDCGEDKSDQSREYYGLVAFESYMRQQVQWLARAIEEPDFQQAPFRVCLLHIPPGIERDPQFIRPQWLMKHMVPLLNRGRIDLLLCGHTHQYAIQPANCDGLEFPMITGDTDTVIRCDVTTDEIRVTSTASLGRSLEQPPVIKARSKL